MSHKLSLSLVLSAALLGGCLMPGQQAKGGVVATGEPVAVVDDVKVWTTTQKEKVAETEYKDSTGAVVGTGAVYADRTQVHTMKIWYPVQGTEQLRDEDFFAITGDKQALDETEQMRARGAKWHRRGLYAMAGGAAGFVASYFIGNPAARTVLMTGGGLVLAGGYYAAWYGAHQMNPETHAVDRSIAERAAQQYNAQLGKTVGLSMTRQF